MSSAIKDDMPRKTAPKQDDPEQVKRFIKAAREIGVDEGLGAFEKALKKVVPPKKPVTRG
jgi:hypothetical protein